MINKFSFYFSFMNYMSDTSYIRHKLLYLKLKDIIGGASEFCNFPKLDEFTFASDVKNKPNLKKYKLIVQNNLLICDKGIFKVKYSKDDTPKLIEWATLKEHYDEGKVPKDVLKAIGILRLLTLYYL